MTRSLKLSRFLLIEQNEHLAWIVNTLTRGVMTCSPLAASKVAALSKQIQIEELLDELDNGFVAGLLGLGVLVSPDTDEMEVLQHQVTSAINDQSTVGFVIVPTLTCNCDCHYCFERDVRHTSDDIGARDIIRFLKAKAKGKESMTIQWFGGEPLQKSELLEYVSREIGQYCDDTGIFLAAGIVTNGVLLSKECAIRLAKYKVSKIQITLEGDKPLHDNIRCTKDRGGTFSRIIENVNYCGDILDISIRVHVSPHNIDTIRQLISDLGDMQLGQKIKEIYFAPLFHFDRFSYRKSFSHNDRRCFTVESFAPVEATLYRLAAESGLPLPQLFDEGFGICTAVKNNTYIIDPLGHLHRCVFHLGDPRKSYGTIYEGMNHIENLIEWMNVRVPRDEECRECKLLPVCLGGCSVKWMNGASKKVICDSLKYNLKQMLAVFYPASPITSLSERHGVSRKNESNLLK